MGDFLFCKTNHRRHLSKMETETSKGIVIDKGITTKRGEIYVKEVIE